MKFISTPEVDMLLVSRSSRNQRQSLKGFVPRIGLSVVDYGRVEEIDSFYMDCQNFRDYYRDPYNKLHRPPVFQQYNGKCGRRARDKCSELLLLPTQWVREAQPVLYPVDYGRQLHLNDGIKLSGFYDYTSCIKYKR
ncbi:uncharacterized protein LOC106086871 [Stomoxys calcitrans]|uniref:Uncharacterized protein n=1 Tax=Stomoxys calcitrans TaxID=35570 RepID=A0A1I8Q435_STOCA|nr:uncharacterized protein LOC106086871 [Stomoxys calcitrans]